RLGPHRRNAHETEIVAVERLDTPAAWWCAECGYLLPPSARECIDPTNGDPMRRSTEIVAGDPACPHCSKHEWIDFGIVPIAMRVRDEEVDANRIVRVR